MIARHDGSPPFVLAEDLLQLPAPEIKNPLQAAFHQDFAGQAASGHGVLDMIANQCSLLYRLECVLVDPKLVRAAPLFIHESMGRIPYADLALPAHRDAMETDAIMDLQALPHLEGPAGEKLKAEPGRSDARQIVRIGKEREYIPDRLGKPLCSGKVPTFHPMSLTAGPNTPQRIARVSWRPESPIAAAEGKPGPRASLLTKAHPEDILYHMIQSPNKDGVHSPKRKPAVRGTGEVERMCSRFVGECRRRGVRLTEQRLAVYRALAGDSTHPTADAVYARLRVAMLGLSRASVYRILESLEREGFSRRVSTTDGVGRFEANLADHQHLVCRRCGRIMDFEADPGIPLPRGGPGGFVPERLDIRIIGTCGKCRRRGGRHNG